MPGNWLSYYERTKESPPNPLLVEAVDLIATADGTALDIGCGSGKDSLFLAQHGFKVTAVDSSTDSLVYLESLSTPSIDAVISNILDFDFQTYDLVHANNVLSFLAREDLHEVLANIVNAMKPGGIFVGNIFGPEDEWNTHETTMTFLGKEDVEACFAQMEIVACREWKGLMQRAVGGTKHWHIVNVISRKL